MTGRLLTADQLAERWQVPSSHVYRLTRAGEIPTVRLGRYYRYRPDAIEAWERGQEGPAASSNGRRDGRRLDASLAADVDRE